MAMTMHVDIVSAESHIFSGVATGFFAPAVLGEIGVLPRHSPLITQVKPGPVRVVNLQGEEETYYVSGGMLEIQPHVVTLLADTALRAKDVDEASAQEARLRAEQAMKDAKSSIDYARAQAELAEAIAQLQTIQQLRKKHRG